MSKPLIWLDLETTGLDPRESTIVEVAAFGAQLDKPFDLTHLYEAVIYHDGVGLSPFIEEMHSKTGLLEACKHSATVLDVAGEKLRRAILDYCGEDVPATLAGATVHFDLGFIRHHWPDVAKWLSRRVYDTSAIGMFCESLGMPPLGRAEGHRAANDVYQCVERAKRCAEWLGNGGCVAK